MRQHFYLLTIAFVLTACNQKGSTTANNKFADTLSANNLLDTVIPNKQEQVKKQLSFKNVSEIVADDAYSVWIELKDSSASLALHFQYKDTLAISYSSECWLIYPYKLDSNKIVVYWDDYIDTKYQFDIVKTINKTDKKLIGKPFMILELVNDTTLKATYPMKDLIRAINASSMERTFFPDKYFISSDGYW